MFNKYWVCVNSITFDYIEIYNTISLTATLHQLILVLKAFTWTYFQKWGLSPQGTDLVLSQYYVLIDTKAQSLCEVNNFISFRKKSIFHGTNRINAI